MLIFNINCLSTVIIASSSDIPFDIKDFSFFLISWMRILSRFWRSSWHSIRIIVYGIFSKISLAFKSKRRSGSLCARFSDFLAKSTDMLGWALEVWPPSWWVAEKRRPQPSILQMYGNLTGSSSHSSSSWSFLIFFKGQFASLIYSSIIKYYFLIYSSWFLFFSENKVFLLLSWLVSNYIYPGNFLLD